MTDEEILNTDNDWETVKDYDNYEINKNPPHVLRNKKTKKLIAESYSKDGYIKIHLNLITKSKHRIVANQWLENPNNLPHVNHIDHNRSNNSIENLEWVSIQENNSKREVMSKRESFDEIEGEITPISVYKGYKLIEGYCFDENYNVYRHIAGKYKLLKCKSKKYPNVILTTDKSKSITVYINKLKDGDFE
jgi:hypothetical protein